MARSFKVPSIVIAVLATALSVTGVVLAATDPNPHGYRVDALNLHGYAPSTADVQISVVTNSMPLVSGDLQIDFQRSLGQLTMGTSVLGSSAQFKMILANQHAYLVNGGTAARPYVDLGAFAVSWLGVSFEMAHPQVNLLAGAIGTDVVTTGPQGEKIHTFQLNGNSIPVGSGFALKNTASLSVTIGRGGELTGVGIQVRSKKVSEEINLTVLSYNKKVTVSAPDSSQVSTQAGGLQNLLKLMNISQLATNSLAA